MAKRTVLHCLNCEKQIIKDEVSLSRKLLGRNIEKYFCIECLSIYIDCTVDDLYIKIQEFRETGCTLFK